MTSWSTLSRPLERTRWIRLLICVAVLLGGNHGLFAQETRPPTTDPTNPPPIEPNPSEVEPTRTDVKSWKFSVGLNSTYDSNVFFVDVNPQADTSMHAMASLGKSWTLKRGEATVSGDISQSSYQNSSSLDGIRYDIGGGFGYALTHRLAWTLSTNVTSGLAQDAKVITDTGVILPSVVARTGSTSTSLTYTLSRESRLQWGFSQQGVGFESTLFKGGSNFGTFVSISRQVGRSQHLGLSASYSLLYNVTGTASIQTYLVDWSVAIGRLWSLHASGGVRPYTIPGQQGFTLSPAASADLRRALRGGQAVSVGYARTIEQAFGLDQTHVVDTVAGVYSAHVTQRLSGDLSASYSHGSYPLIPDQKLIGVLSAGSLSYELPRGLKLSVNASRYTRTYTPSPGVTSLRTTVSLSYGTAWR